jgi:predicted HAD superfamily Cof-like phosphohydrolase
MPRNIFETVYDFNQNTLGIDPRLPMPLVGNEQEWLSGCLAEEAKELADSADLVDQVDALVDSIVFAVGGLYRLGLSVEDAEACVEAVMEANFQKKAGQKAGRVFDGVVDAVKPDGWVGPEDRIRQVLSAPVK